MITKTDAGWIRINEHKMTVIEDEAVRVSHYPIKLCGISFLIVGGIVSILSFVQQEHFSFLLSFGIVILAIGGLLTLVYQRLNKKEKNTLNQIAEVVR
jgi:hypothetical protein